MSKINDFNRSPYYNDFDKKKNYMNIMYKPGYAVQGRELNQAQSITQNQISTFADHVFKNGSKVSNCRTSIVTRNYARLLDVYADTNDIVDVEQFDTSYTLIGEVSKVEGRYIKGSNKTIDGDPATLFLIYTKAGVYQDNDIATFVPGETVAVVDKNGVVVKRVIVRCQVAQIVVYQKKLLQLVMHQCLQLMKVLYTLIVISLKLHSKKLH